MSQTEAAIGNADRAMPESGRNVHDLRAPLVIALGYLDELSIIRRGLLSQLSAAVDTVELVKSAEQFVTEIDSEMGMCIDMIKESLEELDGMIISLREQLQIMKL